MFSLLKKELVLFSPVFGKSIALENVADKVFACKMMGEGIGLINNSNKVYAPCNGYIVMIPETKHAIGIKGMLNVEILIHIGLNTVELNGKGFKVHVKKGDKVKQGQLLISYDNKIMNENKIDLTIVMVIPNSDSFNITFLKNNEGLNLESKLIKLTKK